jgi:hypothetical protein
MDQSEKQIYPSTVFDALPRVVSPADALGNRARGLERELKGTGTTQEEEA